MSAALLWRTVIRHRTSVCRFGNNSYIRYVSLGTKSLKESNATTNKNESGVITTSSGDRTDVSTDVRPLGEKIKENTKTVSYLGVILLGVSVTGVLFYAIFRELFSSSSSNNVYSHALSICVNDTRIQDSLGAPIKGFGEETRRRRRQHVAHSVFERSGIRYMRMQFYIQGTRNKATVHLEKNLNTDKYRYLFVQLDYYPRTTIILEDNRLTDTPTGSNQALEDFSKF